MHLPVAFPLLLALCVILSGCSVHATDCHAYAPASSTASGSKSATASSSAAAANAALYHKYFDLEKYQKDELKSHGYTNAQISKIDVTDYKQIEPKWKLSASDINRAKKVYPSLKNADISGWTNADFDAYTKKQDDLEYAPTKIQAQQLKKRGISQKLAREMLKDYCSYDNMLAQSDSTLSAMMALYKKADDEYTAFEREKEAIRNQFFFNLSGKR